MARMQFGGGPEDVFLITDVEGDLQQGGGVIIRMYSTETGSTPILDLQTLALAPITSVTTSDGNDGRAKGQIAPFLGPDGVYEMWAGADGQPRFLMQASNLGSVLGTAREQLLDHISEVNGHSTGLKDLIDVDMTSVEAASDGQTLVFDAVSGWWEAGAVGGGAATDIVWVAASDAPPAFAAAPYQCDGTADDVQIQLAINNAAGRRVGLSPGTFNLATNPIQLYGSNDVDVEVSRYLVGSGTYATKLVAGSGMSAAIILGEAVSPHVSDLSIEVTGATHGIYSTRSTGPDAGNRSFWHGSLKNLMIRGPWNGTHTGWAMKLGSGCRYVVENIEVSGTGNGIQVLGEDGGLFPGEASFIRCMVDVAGANAIAYQVTATAGNASQIVFSSCIGYARSSDAATVCWRIDGSGANHIRIINSTARQFATTLMVGANAYDIDADFAQVLLRNGATFADLDGYSSHVRCGLLSVESGATVTFVDDDNTFGAKANIMGPVSMFVPVGATVNSDISDTLVLRDITPDSAGTINGNVTRPRAPLARKTVTLTDAGTITLDASQGDDFRVTLGGNRTLAAPSGASDGQHITILVQQDGTGSRTLTWNAVFGFGTITNALTSTASRRDLFEFVYNAGLTKWLVLNASKNLT